MQNFTIKKQYLLPAIAGLALLLGGGFFLNGEEKEEAKPQTPLSVSVTRAEMKEMQQGLRLTGTVEGLTSAIISALPLAFIGALLGLLLFGSGFSMISGIGLLLLMGLVTKNAILLVDYAKVRMAEGHSVNEALVMAGKARFRPILMTTIAMMMGMVPLALALGPGAEARAPMAHAILGGLVTSTILTLVVIPCLYSLLHRRN
ncbi:efflux RND transporter permease subunit [Selenomonas sp. KH1T6]|uniref:efflux RND transporter permease subunit n=1 Tax=Selenomonas sp. KH1T6 TaxID=3158784 RepID=UPI0008A74513|nr:AcrB/AcrD/AcrF family protein [Selenomonas ruminantium]